MVVPDNLLSVILVVEIYFSNKTTDNKLKSFAETVECMGQDSTQNFLG